jgi:multidrug resistance efflux pump
LRASGEAVKKGDLLVELDIARDKKIRQELRTQKAQTELILAKEPRSATEKPRRAAIEMAEKALHPPDTIESVPRRRVSTQLETAESKLAMPMKDSHWPRNG